MGGGNLGCSLFITHHINLVTSSFWGQKKPESSPWPSRPYRAGSALSLPLTSTQPPLLCLSFRPLPPYWPLCSPKTLVVLSLPQGICTCCSSCQDCRSPDSCTLTSLPLLLRSDDPFSHLLLLSPKVGFPAFSALDLPSLFYFFHVTLPVSQIIYFVFLVYCLSHCLTPPAVLYCLSVL